MSAYSPKYCSGAVTISFTEVESLYYTCHNQNYYLINAETHALLNRWLLLLKEEGEEAALNTIRRELKTAGY